MADHMKVAIDGFHISLKGWGIGTKKFFVFAPFISELGACLFNRPGLRHQSAPPHALRLTCVSETSFQPADAARISLPLLEGRRWIAKLVRLKSRWSSAQTPLHKIGLFRSNPWPALLGRPQRRLFKPSGSIGLSSWHLCLFPGCQARGKARGSPGDLGGGSNSLSTAHAVNGMVKKCTRQFESSKPRLTPFEYDTLLGSRARLSFSGCIVSRLP